MSRSRRSSGSFSYSPRSSEAAQHVEAYRALEKSLGPLLHDIRKHFFDFDAARRERLLNAYTSNYGTKAGDYARETMPLWKNGSRKMSGQTAERLINLVPQFLTAQERFALVERVCDHFEVRPTYTCLIDLKEPSSGLAQLSERIRSLSSTEEQLRAIPERVIELAKWLADDDVTIARAILAQVRQKRAEATAEYANKHLERVRGLLAKSQASAFSDVLDFPTGTIRVSGVAKSACFVATAAYGDANHADVVALREFRDKSLMHSALGVSIVIAYYDAAPKLVELISKSAARKRAARCVLMLLVRLLRKRHDK